MAFRVASFVAMFLCWAIAAAPSAATEILFYDFEPPDTTADNLATDTSGNNRDGQLESVGSGSYQYQSNSRPGSTGTQSLRLTENGNDNAARLARDPFTEVVLDFNAQDWTFAAWFNRADNDNDDYIFHIGEGNGHGDWGGHYDRDELGLYAHGPDSVTLEHFFDDKDATEYPPADVNLTASGIAPGTWHHVAIVYTHAGSILEFYVDGTSVGSESGVSLLINQAYPLVIGGHESMTEESNRWFDGNLDDVGLWDTALSAGEISNLAAVPEPGTPLLLTLAAATLWLFRRRLRA